MVRGSQRNPNNLAAGQAEGLEAEVQQEVEADVVQLPQQQVVASGGAAKVLQQESWLCTGREQG